MHSPRRRGTMFVDYHRSVTALLAWQWRSLARFTAIATAVALVELWLLDGWQGVPVLPLTVFGAAIGIFVSFRTNSCYDRWWEARRLWGELVNTSRVFASQVLAYPTGPRAALRTTQEALVRRHIAYVNALRCALRDADALGDADVVRYLEPAELEVLAGDPNIAGALLHRQLMDLGKLARSGLVDGFQLQLLDRSIAEMLAAQGGSERIKRTPFPQTYEFVASLLIGAYCGLLPLGIVAEIGWFGVPISVLVCFAFHVIDQVGTMLEDPFSMAQAALPLDALTTNIEIELLRRLGEPDPPEAPAPNAEGVLM